jgi:hypothetical protein
MHSSVAHLHDLSAQLDVATGLLENTPSRSDSHRPHAGNCSQRQPLQLLPISYQTTCRQICL